MTPLHEWEPWKVVAMGAALGVGLMLAAFGLGLWLSQFRPPQQPQVIIIRFEQAPPTAP